MKQCFELFLDIKLIKVVCGYAFNHPESIICGPNFVYSYNRLLNYVCISFTTERPKLLTIPAAEHLGRKPSMEAGCTRLFQLCTVNNALCAYCTKTGCFQDLFLYSWFVKISDIQIGSEFEAHKN